MNARRREISVSSKRSILIGRSCLPARPNARRISLSTDDLDFFLYSTAAEFDHKLKILDYDRLDLMLNVWQPAFTRTELVDAVTELFANGDFEGIPFQPNRDEVEAGIAGA